MDGKPVAQIYSDELTELTQNYKDSGLTNAEAVGVLTMFTHDLLYKIRKDAERDEKPY